MLMDYSGIKNCEYFSIYLSAVVCRVEAVTITKAYATPLM
jgi:hypothetical protein